MEGRDRIRFDRIEYRSAARHRAGMPMLELPSGDQYHRITEGRAPGGGNDVRGNELASSGGRRKVIGEYHRFAGVAFTLARIGHRTLALHALPGNSCDRWHRAAHLVEHLRHAALRPL